MQLGWSETNLWSFVWKVGRLVSVIRTWWLIKASWVFNTPCMPYLWLRGSGLWTGGTTSGSSSLHPGCHQPAWFWLWGSWRVTFTIAHRLESTVFMHWGTEFSLEVDSYLEPQYREPDFADKAWYLLASKLQGPSVLKHVLSCFLRHAICSFKIFHYHHQSWGAIEDDRAKAEEREVRIIAQLFLL